MRILLIRHGEAEKETAFIKNKDRKLTEKGIKEVEKTSEILFKYLQSKKLNIHSSPFTRTKQTAKIIAQKSNSHIEEEKELLQEDWTLVKPFLEEDCINIFVSHHPFIQSYLKELTGAYIPVCTASCFVIDYNKEKNKGILVAYITPRI